MRPSPWGRRAAVWLTGWLLSGALYLLLIDTVDLPELYAGAVVATLAATGFGLAREQYLAAETFHGAWLRRAWRPVALVPGDVLRVTSVALAQLRHPRQQHGRFVSARFREGEDEAHQIGRRALAESLGSFAPNTIVIGVDPDRELLLGHQLRQKADADIDILGLG